MPIVDVPWPTSSNPGGAPGEGAGRLINCFGFLDNKTARWKPVPGLDDFASLPKGEVRGALYSAGLLTVVAGSKALRVDSSGSSAQYEEQIPGDGPVTIARNNAPTPQIVVVSSIGAYLIVNDVVTIYPDSDLPLVNSVAFLDGYLLFTTADGRIFASDLNSTDINPLSFTSAEARPDGLLRGVVRGQEYLACGFDTIEVYQDAGTSPFPLTRSTVISLGLIGPWAIAGFENGWGGPVIFVAQDGSVRSLEGYTPNRISSEDLENLIARVADKTTLRASVYTFGGNAIWSLSSPTWTWEYNVTTGLWHERRSYQMPRWRGGVSIKAFGEWIVADGGGGRLYRLNSQSRKESAYPLTWGMDSGAVKQFPARVAIYAAYLDFVLGQALIDAQQDEIVSIDVSDFGADWGDFSGPAPAMVSRAKEPPAAMISWSHDGSARWATPVLRSIGKQGETVGRVAVNRLGLTSPAGFRLRFRISHPAYSSFAGARAEVQGRR